MFKLSAAPVPRSHLADQAIIYSGCGAVNNDKHVEVKDDLMISYTDVVPRRTRHDGSLIAPFDGCAEPKGGRSRV